MNKKKTPHSKEYPEQRSQKNYANNLFWDGFSPST